MTPNDLLTDLLTTALADAGFELVDARAVALNSPNASVVVLVDHLVGANDLEAISVASKLVSAILDEADPIDGPYTLEVSSPGLERPLRTAAHFRRFLGTLVKVKLRAEAVGDRRFEGVIEAADDEHVTIGARRVALADIDAATTVFVWGPAVAKGPGKKANGPGQPKDTAKKTDRRRHDEPTQREGAMR